MSRDEGSVMMTRIFDAPRERVFEAWTRAEHLEKWFGPEEIINVSFEQAGSRTKLLLNSTARGVGVAAAKMLAGMQKGWAQTVDRLGVLLDPKPQKEM